MANVGSALRDFCAEADELLDALLDGVDRLETDAGRPEARAPRLHALFRHAHSLKGLAAMSGLSDLASVAHQLEDVLDALRMGKEAWSAGTIEWLREACGALRHEVRRLAAGEPAGRRSLRPLHFTLAAATAAPEPAGAGPELPALDPALRAVLSQYEESRLDFHLRRHTSLAAVRASWSLERMEPGLHDLLQALEPLGEVIATIPERTAAEGAEFLLLVAGDVDKMRQACGERARIELLVRAAAASAPAAPPEEDLGHTLRVDVERLDPIVARAGELALEAGRLQRAMERALEASGHSAELEDVRRRCRNLAGALGDFRNGLLELRMIPIRRLAARLDRTVRDMGRRSGRHVAFHCVGGDTEIDKRIADTLLAALLHLVRNSMDHGVESPEERRAAGKPDEGSITLEATPQGRSVTLRIMDDGRGLDPARLLQAAERLGIDPRKTGGDLSELIFEPGFSTAEEVSETSGRGVGLDEVRQRVKSLKGMLRVRSQAGKGMTFELEVPATLAVVPAFLVRSGPALLALPLGSVLEGRLLRAEEIERVERSGLLIHESRTLPVFLLRDLLGLEPRPDEARGRQALLVARHPMGEIGLAVDALIGQREVMVRPLPGRLAGHPALHGAAELEGDQVALMLDLGQLIGGRGGAPDAQAS